MERTLRVLPTQAAAAEAGYPRLTEDLDLFVRPDLANGHRIVAALQEFGFACSTYGGRRASRATRVVGCREVMPTRFNPCWPPQPLTGRLAAPH